MKIYGQHDARTIAQLGRCIAAESGALGVLCADGHVGYSAPIGAVIAYRTHISPAAVGYDISCGNAAVKTTIRAEDIRPDEMSRIADEVERRISFGIGRKNNEPLDSAVFDTIANSPVHPQRNLLPIARSQLGTVGSGNHYVDILEDQEGILWVACHFGSRGFGHKTASGFMNIAAGKPFDEHSKDGEMDSPPLLLSVTMPSGQDYISAMQIASDYAYAGREAVIAKVLEILQTGPVGTFRVHNNHNLAWKEHHFDEDWWVIRKGATPAFPGQWGFIGGSMGDVSVVLHGVDSAASRDALYSTVHGAGRVMSRAQARKGKSEWYCGRTDCDVAFRMPIQPPKNMKCPVHQIQLQKRVLEPGINYREVQDVIRARGTVLRGGGADEAPAAYRPLGSVLAAHSEMIEIAHVLTPRIVVMAGSKERDPYKD